MKRHTGPSTTNGRLPNPPEQIATDRLHEVAGARGGSCRAASPAKRAAAARAGDWGRYFHPCNGANAQRYNAMLANNRAKGGYNGGWSNPGDAAAAIGYFGQSMY